MKPEQKAKEIASQWLTESDYNVALDAATQMFEWMFNAYADEFDKMTEYHKLKMQRLEAENQELKKHVNVWMNIAEENQKKYNRLFKKI